MEHRSFPPTPGQVLRAEREAAGVTQDKVAEHFLPEPTTRQRLSRWERDDNQVPFVKATAYRAALQRAVAAKLDTVEEAA